MSGFSTKSPGPGSFTQPKQVNLSRRLLFPNLSPDEPLPPLLRAANSASLDAELYDILALALRAFVQPWWLKISRNDKDFIPQISQVIAQVIISLEARLQSSKPELVSFLMEDVPTIITQHYVDFRSAQVKCSTSYASVSSSLPYTFHALQSHMAVTADGSVDETYLRVAVEHVVRECIPVEEWQAETERSIIREVIVNLLIQNFFGLLAQPWFWMRIVLDSLGPPMEVGRNESVKKKPRKKFNFHVVLVYFLSALQTFSGFALTAVTVTVDAYHLMWKSHVGTHRAKEKDHYPSLLRPYIDALSEVLTMRSRHASSAVLSLLSGLIDMFTPFANALAHRILEAYLTQDVARQILINTKRVMFPNNGYPAPRPEDPSLEEQVELRDKLERRLNEIGASHGLPLILGQSIQQRQQTLRDILDPLSLASCNTHLLLYLFDSVLLALFPGLSLGAQSLSIDDHAPSQSGQLTPPDPFFPP